MHDVIVVDEEYTSAASAITTACDEIEKLIGSYLEVLDKVCEEAVTEGTIASGLSQFRLKAQNMRDVATTLAQYNSLVSEMFVSAVDDADTYVY